MYQIHKQNFRSLQIPIIAVENLFCYQQNLQNAIIRFNHALNLFFSSKALINNTILFSGLQLNVSDVWKLFAAIAIHAVAILFSIGAEMVYSGTKRLQVTVFNYRSFKFSSS